MKLMRSITSKMELEKKLVVKTNAVVVAIVVIVTILKIFLLFFIKVQSVRSVVCALQEFHCVIGVFQSYRT